MKALLFSHLDLNSPVFERGYILYFSYGNDFGTDFFMIVKYSYLDIPLISHISCPTPSGI